MQVGWAWGHIIHCLDQKRESGRIWLPKLCPLDLPGRCMVPVSPMPLLANGCSYYFLFSLSLCLSISLFFFCFFKWVETTANGTRKEVDTARRTETHPASSNVLDCTRTCNMFDHCPDMCFKCSDTVCRQRVSRRNTQSQAVCATLLAVASFPIALLLC